MLGVDRWGGVHVDVHVLQVGRCTCRCTCITGGEVYIPCVHAHDMYFLYSHSQAQVLLKLFQWK